MTSPYVSEANKLKNLQNSLEKSYETVLQRIVHMDPNLNGFIKKLHDERTDLTQKQKEILDILEALDKIKYNVNNASDLDLKKLREEMIRLQENIGGVKQGARNELKCLEEQEQVLSGDVRIFQQRLDDWSKPNTTVAKVAREKITKANSSMPPEVVKFEEFLKSNGCTNGWRTNDHIVFIKYYTKYKDVDKMSESLHRIFPDLSTNEIKSHHRWYSEYRQLMEDQRRSIMSWRESSKMSRKESVLPAKPKRTKKKVTPKTDADLKEKLEVWRREKEQRLLFDQKIRQMNEDKRKLNDIIRQMENEEKKRMVLKWKTEKQEVSEILDRRRHEETKLKPNRGSKNISDYQNRDAIYIEKRKVKKQRSTSSELSLSSYGTVGPREASSLYNPTKQWISRTSRRSKKNERFYCDIMQTNSIGIPAWRRETYA